MKYILSLALVFFIFGCDDKVQGDSITSSLEDTEQLQPKVEDKNLQPPTPPSISIEE